MIGAEFKGDKIELKWNSKDLESLRQVVESYCSGRRAVVQAGGCLGVFPRWLATRFQRVYTFEPDPDLFRLLVHNVPESNVIFLQAALGQHRGRMLTTRCELRGDDGKTVLHPGMTRTEPGELIPTLRVDDLGLEVCDLIYLDVEGDELYALNGAWQTINHCKPVVACEINRGIDYRGIEREKVHAYLGSLGYKHAAMFRSDYVFLPS